jgi:uncharacterized protein (TIGR00297 family)
MVEMFLVGLLLIGGASVSYQKRWLTAGGAAGMVVLGAAIDWAFGLSGLLIIFLFFVAANLISNGGRPAETRTVVQVFANGGAPLLAACANLAVGGPYWSAAFITAVASASADTWASEIGVKFGGRPYHIGLRRRVAPGLSGAATLRGSIAGLFGAALIGFFGAFLLHRDHLALFFAAGTVFTAVGWLGHWLDTLLGAFLQARYQCRACGVLTDDRRHCEMATVKVHGYQWMTNHTVNALSNIGAGVLGAVTSVWISS